MSGQVGEGSNWVQIWSFYVHIHGAFKLLTRLFLFLKGIIRIQNLPKNSRSPEHGFEEVKGETTKLHPPSLLLSIHPLSGTQCLSLQSFTSFINEKFTIRM